MAQRKSRWAEFVQEVTRLEDEHRALMEDLQNAPPTPAAEAAEIDETDEQAGRWRTSDARAAAPLAKMATEEIPKQLVGGLSAHLGTEASAKRAIVGHHVAGNTSGRGPSSTRARRCSPSARTRIGAPWGPGARRQQSAHALRPLRRPEAHPLGRLTDGARGPRRRRVNQLGRVRTALSLRAARSSALC